MLNDYMLNWLTTYKMGIVKQSTYDRYESTFENQIKDTLGKMQMGGITARDIQELINEKANPKKNKYRPLSYSSLKKILEILNQCFEFAVSQGDLYVNPTKNVSIPHRYNIVIKKKELYTLTDEEMLAIKNVADMYRKNGEPYYRYAAVYMIMLSTGMRVGEMLALTWDDINFDTKIVSVNKAILSSVKQRKNTSDNKRHSPVSSTKNADRFIILNETALYYFMKLKEYKESHKINTNNVVYTEKGSAVSSRNLQRTLDLVLEKAGVPHCGLHTLRHTFGSTLLRRGVDISVVSKLMGHSSITITYNHYIHIIDEQKAHAVDLINVL